MDVGVFVRSGAPAGSEVGVSARAWVCCSGNIGRDVWTCFQGIARSLGCTVVSLVGILNLSLGRLVSPAGSRITLGSAQLPQSPRTLGPTGRCSCCFCWPVAAPPSSIVVGHAVGIVNRNLSGLAPPAGSFLTLGRGPTLCSPCTLGVVTSCRWCWFTFGRSFIASVAVLGILGVMRGDDAVAIRLGASGRVRSAGADCVIALLGTENFNLGRMVLLTGFAKRTLGSLAVR